jgi:hypothetical protein
MVPLVTRKARICGLCFFTCFPRPDLPCHDRFRHQEDCHLQWRHSRLNGRGGLFQGAGCDYASCFVESVVESEDIGAIGRGEATISHLKFFNNWLGVDEIEFVKATRATFTLVASMRCPPIRHSSDVTAPPPDVIVHPSACRAQSQQRCFPVSFPLHRAR